VSFVPPYKLDPYVAVRNPGGLPKLMQRGIYDVIQKEKDGSLYDKYIKGFNVIAFSLTESKRLYQGKLELTAVGLKREKEVSQLQDTKEKMRKLAKLAEKLKAQFPGRFDKSWYEDDWRGVNPQGQQGQQG